MLPAWWIADGLGGTVVAVYVMRVINALLIALLAPMAVVVAWRLAPGRPEVAALAALFAALLPGLALNATRVGNDALGAVLGGAAVVLAIRWTGGAWTARRALLLGLALGAGVLVKLTLLGLAPAVAVAMLWPGGGVTPRRRVVLLVLAGAVAALCLGIWFVINLQLYGVPVPSARTNRLSIIPPMSFDLRYIPFDLAFFVVSYWSGEPLGALPLAAGFVMLGSLIAVIAIVGLVRQRVSGSPVYVALAAIAGMLAVALLLPATAAFQFAGPGRYEYPALPAIAALLAIGLTAALAMTLWMTVNTAEVVRGGIQSIPHGQFEAARSSGLSELQTMRYVIFPQAVRRMLPPLVGLCTILVKDTSLAAIIGVFELTRAAQETIERTFRSFEIYLAAGAIYFIVCFPLTRLAQRAEARLPRS